MFRRADEVDGAEVFALLVPALGITPLAMLIVHFGSGGWLIRRRPLDRGRTVPIVALLAAPS